MRSRDSQRRADRGRNESAPPALHPRADPWAGSCASLGRVVRRCLTDVEITPHDEQPAALDAVVTTCTNRTGLPRSSVSRSTR
jgi:hypothetical protein